MRIQIVSIIVGSVKIGPDSALIMKASQVPIDQTTSACGTPVERRMRRQQSTM